MGKESEIDILDVDRKEVVRRLRQLGAKHEGLHRFRRIEFLIEGDTHGRHSWARVRTNGKETTITLKETQGRAGFTSMKEYEVRASDFAEAVRIMSRLTKSKVLYWENERDAYRLGDAQVTIDKWPGIPALVEIEAPTMRKVKEAYKRLGVKGRFVGNTPIHKVYEIYGLNFRKVVGKNGPKLKRLLKGG
jgi:predicted adenylyl cyclase CyaB